MYKQKIKEILIGTNNKGKLREIRELIPKKVNVLSLNHITDKSPKETSKTFKGNSFLKAKYYSKLTGKICLADDSGLEIDFLNRAPGIYSARWSGKKNNFNLAIKKIFKKIHLKDKNWKNRKLKARFKCALTIYGPGFKPVSVIGKIEGTISNKKLGNKGFGYDPIFIPLGKKITFGQMSPNIKLKMDHRYIAFKKIRKFF